MTRNILIADDDRITLDALTAALEERGLNVVPCPDEATAHARIRAGGLDAAFFDIRSSQEASLELLRGFRRRQPRMPAFVASEVLAGARLGGLDTDAIWAFDYPADLIKLCDVAAEVAGHPVASRPVERTTRRQRRPEGAGRAA